MTAIPEQHKVSWDVDDAGIARVVLRRPRASNALDMASAHALSVAVRSCADNTDVRVIVLSGEGRNFCAGGDVRGMVTADHTATFVRDLADTAHSALSLLNDIPVPVVASVQGAAAGAGLGLVLASDYVVAGRSSSFVAAYSAAGLTPDCGVSLMLPRVVGLRRATQMLLFSQKLSSADALQWGLVTEVVDDDSIVERSNEVAAQLASAPYPATGQTRRLLRKSFERMHSEHLDDEAATISAVSASGDATVALKRIVRA